MRISHLDGTLSAMGHCTARRVQRCGNTILELLCALAIISIFAAAGTPRFARAIAARRAEAAARRLSADIEWLRSTARSTSSTQSIAFSGSSYSLTGLTNPDFPGTPYSVNLADTSYKAAIASLNLGGATTLSFNGYGTPSAGGAIVVQSGSSTRTVTIEATSGIVSWQ
ncbi:MAG: type II secretion system protein [Pirellulales bacterium]